MNENDAIRIAVEMFNARYKVGCSVVVHRDFGDKFPTVTKGEAFIAESGHAVIQVVGISGYYLLSRVFPVEVKP